VLKVVNNKENGKSKKVLLHPSQVGKELKGPTIQSIS
jgi:hypothetical protein